MMGHLSPNPPTSPTFPIPPTPAVSFTGASAARRFAEAHFLSANGMEELHGTRRTLANTLSDIGFAPRGSEKRNADGHAERQTNLVRALVCAGLYPNLVKIRMPETRYDLTAAGAVEHINDEARAVKFFEVPGSRVFLHPSCAMFTETTFERTRWLVFTSKSQMHGDKTYVKDVTAVSPLALLLFGGEVDVHHDKGTVTIDGKITFESPGRVAVPVRELRANLDKLLREKIAEPSLDIASHPIVEAIVNLIGTERAGFS